MILFTNEKLCVLNLSKIEFLVATYTDSDVIGFKAVINAERTFV